MTPQHEERAEAAAAQAEEQSRIRKVSIREPSTEDQVQITPDTSGGGESDISSSRSSGFTRRQLLVLMAVAYGNFWIAACVSLQAPFFPAEAEDKGATPSQYGLVFGVYELVIVVISPLCGKLMGVISPNFLIQAGLMLTGVSTILFG